MYDTLQTLAIVVLSFMASRDAWRLKTVVATLGVLCKRAEIDNPFNTDEPGP